MVREKERNWAERGSSKREKGEDRDHRYGYRAYICNFSPTTSLWKNPNAFTLVFPQLVFEEDQPVYEKLEEIGVLEHTAQVALQVNVSSIICMI